MLRPVMRGDGRYDRTRRALLAAAGGALLTGLTARARAGAPGPSLADRARALLASLGSEALAPFLADWPAPATRPAPPPATLPVLRWLPALAAAAPAPAAAFTSALARAAGTLAWRRSYAQAEVGERFLANYGWSELVGLTGAQPGTRVACGVLLLGPATDYPRHRHEAEEIYVPLAGHAQWAGGDGEFVARAPLSVIHHERHEPHAMRTGGDGLLALYVWRSRNLDQKSELVPVG